MLTESVETYDFVNTHAKCSIVNFSRYMKWNSDIVYVLDRYCPQNVSGNLESSMLPFSPLNSHNMIMHPISMLLNIFDRDSIPYFLNSIPKCIKGIG